MDSLPPEHRVEAPSTVQPAMARYLAIWAATMAGVLALSIAFCALMDPYAVIGTKRIAGLNADKPAAADWPRLSKAYMIQRAKPATLILGASTADLGFNTQSPAWPQAARPVFNLALEGALPYVDLRYFQHALAVSSPSHVILAVNFLESLIIPQKLLTAEVQSQFDIEPRLLVTADGSPNPARPRAHFADLVFATLSFDAVADSFRTLLTQHRRDAATLSASGWNNGAMMQAWTQEEGTYALVMRKDAEKIAQVLRWRQNKMVQIEPVLQIVRLARARGIAVSIVILPNQVDEMEFLRALGLDADYESWKTRLVSEVTKTASDGGVTIWDFSGYSPYTTEELPAPGDRRDIWRWFWEPLHIKPALGDRMIARMEGSDGIGDFGVALTPANVADQIAAYHRGQSAWVATHSADVKRVSALVDRLTGKVSPPP